MFPMGDERTAGGSRRVGKLTGVLDLWRTMRFRKSR